MVGLEGDVWLQGGGIRREMSMEDYCLFIFYACAARICIFACYVENWVMVWSSGLYGRNGVVYKSRLCIRCL